jgi:probable phosphoglycerate mutase
MKRATVLAAALAALLSQPLDAQAQADTSRWSTILLVRHAEKAGPSGNVPLTPAGKIRALRLAAMLRDAQVGHIFTTDTIRTRDTAEPLVKRTGVIPQVMAGSGIDALVSKLRLLPAGAVALVVHHSNTLPDIVEKLGGPRLAPIGDAEFDRLLVLTRSPEGTTRVVTLRY